MKFDIRIVHICFPRKSHCINCFKWFRNFVASILQVINRNI
nr:MAG TPA: hypothetical protein [Inoviridae sp.]